MTTTNDIILEPIHHDGPRVTYRIDGVSSFQVRRAGPYRWPQGGEYYVWTALYARGDGRWESLENNTYLPADARPDWLANIVSAPDTPCDRREASDRVRGYHMVAYPVDPGVVSYVQVAAGGDDAAAIAEARAEDARRAAYWEARGGLPLICGDMMCTHTACQRLSAALSAPAGVDYCQTCGTTRGVRDDGLGRMLCPTCDS